MYIPNHYKNTDREDILNFINAYSFATIVTARDNFPVATHLPFVISESDGDIILTSHFAKANPQSLQITEMEVLVIFSGPHAYISPGFYDSKVNVPTWNYIAVHAYGNAEIITGEEKSFEVLEAMINNFEKEYFAQWKALPQEYKMKMVKGITAFKIRVTDIQGKKKISQNKKEHEQERIIKGLAKSPHPHEVALAEFMKKEKGRD